MTAPAYGYIHSATVHSLDEVSGGVYLQGVPLAPTSRWGPVPTCVYGLQAGDRVVAASIGLSRDTLIVIGKVGDRLPDIGDIPGLVAALAGKADDSEITAINGTLAAHTTTLNGHTATLLDHTTTLAGHTGTLAGNTATLTTQGTRITTLEGKTGYVLAVPDALSRPTSGLYNGYPIYRTDKLFLEFYNGAGAWRVRQFCLVSALADVEFPVGGLVVLLGSDLMMYRYVDTSTGWLPFLHTAPSGGHARYKLASGHPNISSGTVTKVALSVADTTTADVTRSADFKDFTLNRTGTWFLSCRLPWSGGVTAGLSRWSWIASSTDNTLRHISASTPPSGFIMVPTASDIIRLTSGTVLSLYAYQDSGGALGFDISQSQGQFTARWMGP